MKRLLFFLTLDAAVASPQVLAQADQVAPTYGFAAEAIVVVSDGDMLASAYEDGQLGPREGRDVVSIVPLAGKPILSEATVKTLPVSNSVAGPPNVAALSPTGPACMSSRRLVPAPARATRRPSETSAQAPNLPPST